MVPPAWTSELHPRGEICGHESNDELLEEVLPKSQCSNPVARCEFKRRGIVPCPTSRSSMRIVIGDLVRSRDTKMFFPLGIVVGIVSLMFLGVGQGALGLRI